MSSNSSVRLLSLVFLSFLLVLVAGQPAQAQSSQTVNYQEHIHLTSFLSESELPGTLNDTLVHGRYLYGITGSYFCVIDVVDRHRPQLLSSIKVLTGTSALAMSPDDRHVVVLGQRGLAIIDCGDPAAPLITDTYGFDNWSTRLAVLGYPNGRHMALATCPNDTMTILFDITYPDDIRTINYVEVPPGVRNMVGHGDFVYLCHSDGIAVLDLSEPASPMFVGTVGQGNSYINLVCQEDFAFVTGSSFPLHVYDLSDPAAPVLIGECNERYFGSTLAVAGDRAYVEGGSGFAIFDVSNPAEPTMLVDVGAGDSVSIAGSDCYVFLGYYDGLRILTVDNPTLAGPFNPPFFLNPDFPDYGLSSLMEMVRDGDRTYICANRNIIYVYDWEIHSDPQYLNHVFLGISDINGMAVTGDILLLGDGASGVRIMDLWPLNNPTECGYVNTPGYAQDIFVFGTVALVVDEGTIQILDFTDPYQAIIVGYLDTPGNGRGAVLVGDTLFLATYDAGVQVIDVADPLAPVIIGSAAADGAYRLAWDNDMLAVAVRAPYADEPGIRLFDVTDPASPAFLGSAHLPSADDVALVDDFVYVAAGDDGIIVLNARVPVNPFPMGSIFGYDLDYNPTDLFRLDDYILCGYYLGMVPLQQQGVSGLGDMPRPAVLRGDLRACPNPFNPQTRISFNVEQAGPVTLRIYDLAGRKVATLADRVYSAGVHEVDWNGQDNRGQAVPSGVYCVEVNSQDGRSMSKISLVK